MTAEKSYIALLALLAAWPVEVTVVKPYPALPVAMTAGKHFVALLAA